MTTTRPVFIRLPEAEADRLTRVCATRGMTKQAFVRAAVAARLDSGGEGLSDAVPDRDEVLTLDELARLLRVQSDVIRTRVEAGELPGRRFGDEWRFSRTGVLTWLAGVEDVGRRAPGFEAPKAS